MVAGPDPFPTTDRPGHPSTLGLFVVAGLGLTTVVSAVGLGGEFVYARSLAQVIAAPATAGAEGLSGLEVVLGVVGILELLLTLGTGVLFIAWFHGSHKALPPGTSRQSRHSPGWAIGSWFVPFLNLVRPKQMMDDLWELAGHRPRPNAPFLGQGRAPSVVGWWWAAFLLAQLAGQAASNSLDLAPDLAALRTDSIVFVIQGVLVVAAGCLAIWLVMSIRHRFDAVTVADVDALDREPLSLATIGLGAGSLLLAGVTALGTSSFLDVSGEGDGGVAAATTGRVQFDALAIGSCFQDPGFGEVSTALQVPCAELHDFEVIALPTHVDAPAARWPGADEVFAASVDRCIGAFDERFTIGYEAAIDHDVYIVNPTAGSWRQGDRTIVCAVYRLDEQPMRGLLDLADP